MNAEWLGDLIFPTYSFISTADYTESLSSMQKPKKSRSFDSSQYV